MGCFSAFLQRILSLFEFCGLQDYEVAEVAPNWAGGAPVSAILLPQQGQDLEISPSLGAPVQGRSLSAFAQAAVIQSEDQHWQRILPSFHPSPLSVHDMVQLQQSNGQIRLVSRLVALQAGGVPVQVTGSYRVLPLPYAHAYGIALPYDMTAPPRLHMTAAPRLYDMTTAPRLLLQPSAPGGVQQQSTFSASLPPTLTALPSCHAPSSVESTSLRDSYENEGAERQAYAVDMRCPSSPILFPRGRCAYNGNVVL